MKESSEKSKKKHNFRNNKQHKTQAQSALNNGTVVGERFVDNVAPSPDHTDNYLQQTQLQPKGVAGVEVDNRTGRQQKSTERREHRSNTRIDQMKIVVVLTKTLNAARKGTKRL